MFLQIQTRKQFLVPFQVSVGLKQHKTSMDLVQRGHERATTLLELLETQGIEKNKELVDNLVSLQDDFLALKKKVKSLNDGTVFFAFFPRDLRIWQHPSGLQRKSGLKRIYNMPTNTSLL